MELQKFGVEEECEFIGQEGGLSPEHSSYEDWDFDGADGMLL